MAVPQLAYDDHDEDPYLGESRARVLGELHDAAAPLGVGDVATRVGLHPNTARFHLDALVESGLAERMTEPRDQPGRPRVLYAVRPGTARVGRRSYRLLAEILASYLAAEVPQPARAAVRAGQAWGRFLAARPRPFRRMDAAAATEQLVDALAGIGFVSAAQTVGRQRRVLLHHCPFRETAEEHREVVCSVHLGLMQGLLGAIDAPIDAERLEPFAEPNLCIAHLAGRKKR
ncbi:MAG TPA: helix-turn-helix domain-containing protein [Jiangellales bacterium]|nr:helix-turn-helix domain-containing protein [Jiangellales bacterium]